MAGTHRLQVIELLKAKDIEVRCAAALVAGRLKPVDAALETALKKGLKASPEYAKSYFLDAMAQSGSREFITDFLDAMESKGTLVEQALHLVQNHRSYALNQIRARHEGRRGWINGAYIKAVAGIANESSAKMLVDRLPYCGWEHARATSMFIFENADRFPQRGRAYMLRTLIAYLENFEFRQRPHLEVTCLKSIPCLSDDLPFELFLGLAEDDEAISVRTHALKGLEKSTKTSAFILNNLERFLALLSDPINHVAAAARELFDAKIPFSKLGNKHLRRLLESPQREARDFALQSIASGRGKRALPLLIEKIEGGNKGLRQAALTALSTIPGATDALLALFIANPEVALRKELAPKLLSIPLAVSSEQKKNLVKQYVDRCLESAHYDGAILQFLAGNDAEFLAKELLTRSKRFLRQGHFERVIALLQPLVRHRYANEEARYILAKANLSLANHRADPSLDDLKANRSLANQNKSIENSPPEANPKAYRQRFADLLSPLAKVRDFDLAKRVARDKDYGALEILDMIDALINRGPVEEKAARELLDQLDARALSGTLLARYRKSQSLLINH